MASNYIVLRDSPDWLSFDLDGSREFCISHHLPETLIIDFAGCWNASFQVDFLHFRHALKNLSLANFNAVRGATLLSRQEFRSAVLAPDDLVVFTDDDDWLSPSLFARLPVAAVDGLKWGSIRVGPIFSHGSHVPEFVVQRRPVDSVIYTNNYAVTGRSLERLGFESLFMHWDAQARFDGHSYEPVTVSQYLSCANKHPCCTNAALHFMQYEPFLENPRSEIETFADALAEAEIPPDLAWITEPLAELRSLISRALRR